MARLTIGEVARQAGICPSAIRYYEEIGLLPRPERVGGQRRYDTDVLTRLALVQMAQEAGFTIEEVRRLVAGFLEGTPASKRWRELAHRKLPEVDARIVREAHALMLAATGILSSDHAAALLRAIRTVTQEGGDAFAYAPAVEDLFFAVEARLIDLAGPDAGGNLQIARSRNDLDAVMCRLFMRERLLSMERSVTVLRETLLDLAEDHVQTLMPGITHTQPAQPTTLAHYLLGVLGPLERDSERLRQAYARINQLPLGAAAFTTTSFPIDRALTGRLLGFEGIVENGYDAVSGSDHMLEATQALVTVAASLSRFVHDLLIWARAEAGILRIDDAFVQISSIMPQKRNPV
ncbi:MAG: lyase family protein, partial [Chloroflexota bacterium]|nr:lyase family protein [Chloroflexota bacterium]